MKKMVLIAMLLVMPAALPAEDAKPLTYDECVKIALQNSHEYKMQYEKMKQANLARISSIGSILPVITLNHNRSFGEDFTEAINGQWESTLKGYQPVFSGFSRVTGMLEKDRTAVKEEFNLKAAEKKVKEDIASSFFGLAAAQSELIITQEALNLMKEREKELTQREALGKSRLSELYSVQSSVSVYTAQLELVKSSVEKAADTLEAVMGVTGLAIIQPAETADVIELFDAKSMAANQPEIKSVDAEIEAQGRAILAQEGLYLPDVGLSVSKGLGGNPYTGDEWTFMLQASWTLFDGGNRVLSTMSEFSEEERLKQKKLQLQKAMENEIAARLLDYEASVKRASALKDAFDKSDKSFKLMQKDYRYGMATNIEVIQSMTDMINVKKALDAELIAKEKNKVLIEILK